jgi:hypothetical protein
MLEGEKGQLGVSYQQSAIFDFQWQAADIHYVA